MNEKKEAIDNLKKTAMQTGEGTRTFLYFEFTHENQIKMIHHGQVPDLFAFEQLLRIINSDLARALTSPKQ